jgi:hypothetical protein
LRSSDEERRVDPAVSHCLLLLIACNLATIRAGLASSHRDDPALPELSPPAPRAAPFLRNPCLHAHSCVGTSLPIGKAYSIQTKRHDTIRPDQTRPDHTTPTHITLSCNLDIRDFVAGDLDEMGRRDRSGRHESGAVALFQAVAGMSARCPV